MYWVLDGLNCSRFDDNQGTRGQGHCLNGSHGIRCQTVQVGLDIISEQLTKQSTVSKERTKFRHVDDIEKRGQHRALRKAMRDEDPLGPRGPMDDAEGAAIEE